LHKGGVYGIAVDASGRVVSGGGDALIKFTKHKNLVF
jgi:hypothetical protein